jgi:hypothetical protein
VTPSFEYVYGDVPPDPLTVTLPVALPKQRTFVCDARLADSAAAGCVIVTGTVVMHPFASFTVIVVAPAASPLNVPLAWNVTPSFEYVYGGVPPDPLAVTLPVALPKQRTFVCDPTLAASGARGCEMDTARCVTQFVASVTVTV